MHLLRIGLLLTLYAAFVVAPSVQADSLVSIRGGHVLDRAELLNSAALRALSTRLKRFESSTNTDVLVVTVPSLKGESIESAALSIGLRWDIGRQGNKNGVLFLISPTDRMVRIDVSPGLQDKLTDAVARHIVQNIVLPLFNDDAFQDGIVEGTTAILTVLQGPALTPKKNDEDGFLINWLRSHSGYGVYFWFGLLVLFPLLPLINRRYRLAKTDVGRRQRRLSACNGPGHGACGLFVGSRLSRGAGFATGGFTGSSASAGGGASGRW